MELQVLAATISPTLPSSSTPLHPAPPILHSSVFRHSPLQPSPGLSASNSILTPSSHASSAVPTSDSAHDPTVPNYAPSAHPLVTPCSTSLPYAGPITPAVAASPRSLSPADYQELPKNERRVSFLWRMNSSKSDPDEINFAPHKWNKHLQHQQSLPADPTLNQQQLPYQAKNGSLRYQFLKPCKTSKRPLL